MTGFRLARPLTLAVCFLLLSACGDSANTDVGAGPPSTSPRPGDEVGGEWQFIGSGTDEGVAWAIAGKSDGDGICYYEELDPPPESDYFVDPHLPPGSAPRDVLSPEGIKGGSSGTLNEFAGCALVPPRLGTEGQELRELEANDAAYAFVEETDRLEYRYVTGVVSADASAIHLYFDDGTTKDLTPLAGHFMAVYASDRHLDRFDVTNGTVTVTCRIVGKEFEERPDCGNPVIGNSATTPP